MITGLLPTCTPNPTNRPMRKTLLALTALVIAAIPVRAQDLKIAPDSDHTFADVPWGSSAQTVKALFTAKDRKDITGHSRMPWEQGLHYVRTEKNGDMVFSRTDERKTISHTSVVAHMPKGRLQSVDVSLTIGDDVDRTRLFDLMSRMTTLMWGEPRATAYEMAEWFWSTPGGHILMRTVTTGIHMSYESAEARSAQSSDQN